MPVDDMTVDDMPMNEMSVDEMTYCQNICHAKVNNFKRTSKKPTLQKNFITSDQNFKLKILNLAQNVSCPNFSRLAKHL